MVVGKLGRDVGGSRLLSATHTAQIDREQENVAKITIRRASPIYNYACTGPQRTPHIQTHVHTSKPLHQLTTTNCNAFYDNPYYDLSSRLYTFYQHKSNHDHLEQGGVAVNYWNPDRQKASKRAMLITLHGAKPNSTTLTQCGEEDHSIQTSHSWLRVVECSSNKGRVTLSL